MMLVRSRDLIALAHARPRRTAKTLNQGFTGAEVYYKS